MEDTMQFLTRITLRMLLAVASIALLTPSYANAEDFYAGKTITVIVGVSAGSGGDVSARTFMAGLTEKIPGNPKIIVRNMEGAGGAVARTVRPPSLGVMADVSPGGSGRSRRNT